MYVKKSYSSDEYSKLSSAQKNAIREARLKYKESRGQSNSNSNVNEIASTICESITETMHRVISDGMKNANKDNDKIDGASALTDNPTQQFKRRKRE